MFRTAWAFAAVDGDPSTAWKSRPDGQTEGNEPLPPDRTPSGRIDLAQPATLSHIEVLGSLGSDVVVEVSLDPGFSGAKPLPLPNSSAAPQPEILKATYGIDGREADVTAAVREHLKSGAAGVVANNALAGSDPAPNTPKRLRVEIKTGDQTAIREVAENAMLELATPPLTKVDLPADTRAQYIRIRRATPGDPLVVNELRVFGRF